MSRLINDEGLFDPAPKYEPGSAASNLGCLLYTFCEGAFIEQVRNFVRAHAAEFVPGVRPVDGSQPLRWTELHAQFRQLFEAQLEAVLTRERIGRNEFLEYAAELRQACRGLEDGDAIPCSGGLKVRGFQAFLRNLTASEDYEGFLDLMLAAASAVPPVAPGQGAAAPAPAAAPAVAASVATVEVDVTVPEGVAAGQLLAIDYGGVQYQVPVPPGAVPGSAFRVALQVAVS
mmetsp:Transcript_46344/g.128936  ORF Transcript_46344/g.128936 Transcript_46344/m.128936 type:complete len:231 (-) Transcript_46344:102-794(-)